MTEANECLWICSGGLGICDRKVWICTNEGPKETLNNGDKPLSPKWFIQAMALLAVAGMTIPLVAGVAGFLKDELMSPASLERTS